MKERQPQVSLFLEDVVISPLQRWNGHNRQRVQADCQTTGSRVAAVRKGESEKDATQELITHSVVNRPGGRAADNFPC